MRELDDYRKFMSCEELHKSLNSLAGILRGIILDRVVNEKESAELKNWYELHKHLINCHPFKEILPAIDLALSDDVLELEEVECVLWLCDKFLSVKSGTLYFDMITSKLQYLQGIMYGIVADGVITDGEIELLDKWISENSILKGLYPYDEVFSLLLEIRKDGIVTDYERNTLKAFFASFVDMRESYNLNEADIKQLQKEYSVGGICEASPNVKVDGSTFCFTGESKKAKRFEIAAHIEAHGGKYLNNVSKKIDYLIVGADGNPCWAFSCYGRKVEAAIALRKTGGHIEIIHENDFWDAIGDI